MEIGQIRAMSPIVLAYIGDATYEQKVRRRLIMLYPNDKINELHKKAVSFAQAKSQAKIVQALREKEMLTEEEWYFVKRGRNAQSIPPKNANVVDYRYATGFEALIGYLALCGEEERIDQIVDLAFEMILKK
ncbi:MAG: ribonuclease III domain-containing protein [Peptostreptococcaceae bacterium]|nr:ribonuclease III domain-containing protein [Peptostreptococcaceae bacterium]